MVGVLLYVTVGGVNIAKDYLYVIGVTVIGTIGLTLAYSHVANWLNKQKKGTSTKAEQLMFTLFYNNAFYVFLVFSR